MVLCLAWWIELVVFQGNWDPLFYSVPMISWQVVLGGFGLYQYIASANLCIEFALFEQMDFIFSALDPSCLVLPIFCNYCTYMAIHEKIPRTCKSWVCYWYERICQQGINSWDTRDSSAADLLQSYCELLKIEDQTFECHPGWSICIVEMVICCSLLSHVYKISTDEINVKCTTFPCECPCQALTFLS